jgi:hypothetical protein
MKLKLQKFYWNFFKLKYQMSDPFELARIVHLMPSVTYPINDIASGS